jgi:FAD/FMN-containing dehydrogenase
LLKLESPLAACKEQASSAVCGEFFKGLKNPYLVGDQPALTQTSGWVGAWTSKPSAYAVAAASTQDVVAAVNFARRHNLRLVVKGGGHSYQGTSNAPDSLLIWTRAMNQITLHEAFVPRGCEKKQLPQTAVTVEAGAIWMHTYDAVTTKGGRYVQGGGCATVGVAGLIQSGGFGSFSKNYGLAAAGLLEAEVVTADGTVRIANQCSEPELFWGIKGGGGGSLGVVTKVTLRTRELPEFFGGAFGKITASSDAAYRKLIARVIGFYQESLFNPHWGEQIVFAGNTVSFQMVFQGLSQQQAKDVWEPFIKWVQGSPQEYSLERPILMAAIPARSFWDAEFWKKYFPSFVVFDDRPGAPERNIFWIGDQAQAGQVLHGYRSAWLPDSLLQPSNQQRLADALFASTRHWGVSLHFNKGLAGAPAAEIKAAQDTATNPAVLNAFALAICGSDGPPAFPGVAGHEPDIEVARRNALAVGRSMDELVKVVPHAGSYVSESDFFERAWQESFWGSNFARLAKVKQRYDPAGLFFVHHGVGSDGWSADGFERIGRR